MRIFSANESKAWSEKFNILYSVFWIGFLAWVVTTGHYEEATPLGWLMYGVVVVLPLFIVPILVPGSADKHLEIVDRHWFKANVWIFIFGFVGNYFWTHYFYNLLGAAYTMDTYRINNVPYVMFLLTQAYFMFYHTLTNIILRVFYNLWPKRSLARFIVLSILITSIAFVTSFLETFTLHNVCTSSFLQLCTAHI